jgi:nucleoside 2-deoxyribosyltransferase
MKIYLAGPITGLSWEEATTWRTKVTGELQPFGIECFSPLRAKNYLSHLDKLEDKYDAYCLSTARGIYTRDKWDSMRCDLLFVNFLGASRVSIGTVLEIAWADSKKTPIIVVMEENNVHRHSMITECVGFNVSTVQDGIDVAKSLLLA